MKILPKISSMSVIRPESHFNLTWMLLQFVIYSIFLSTVSITLFFRDEVFSRNFMNNGSDEKAFNIIFILAVTIFDGVKELNCGFYYSGEVVVDRKKIARRYFSSMRIYFDILAFFSVLSDMLPLEWASVYVIQILKMFIFFKLYTVYEVVVKIQTHFLFSVKWNNWIHLTKLLFFALFVCHVMAILYYVRR